MDAYLSNSDEMYETANLVLADLIDQRKISNELLQEINPGVYVVKSLRPAR